MSYQYEEWEASRKKDKKERIKERMSDLRLAQQAEVAAKLLTGDPSWDAFLQILQSEADYCRDRRRDLEERICSPEVSSMEEIQRLRMEAMRAKTIAETLDRVIELPTALKAKGEKARDILRTYVTD